MAYYVWQRDHICPDCGKAHRNWSASARWCAECSAKREPQRRKEANERWRRKRKADVVLAEVLR
jgi:5-methylcytosine-specific restriction endonuclease McrA